MLADKGSFHTWVYKMGHAVKEISVSFRLVKVRGMGS